MVYNNDICTFAGDKATFMQGNLVVLNYNLDDNPKTWTAIEVYKNDVLLGTYPLADIDQDALPESQKGHALVLGNELAAGKYKARMTDGTDVSDYTYWEILDSTVSVVHNSDGTLTVSGNASGKIAYIMCGKKGYTQDTYMYHGFWHGNVCLPPTFYESIENKMTFNPVQFRQEYGYYPTNTTHIVVMIEGNYGIAGTMPIQIEQTGLETVYPQDVIGD